MEPRSRSRATRSRSYAGIVTAVLVLVAAAVLTSGSGDGAPTSRGAASWRDDAAARVTTSRGAAAFAWLRPGRLPAGWSRLRMPGSPARLPVPRDWHAAGGDPGTRTAELTGPRGAIVGYLNATPLQGEETLANWSEFRIAHNRDEGDRGVRLLASATGLRFAGATGSCVLDSYRTSADRGYREIACVLAGHSAATVIVAAAPPARWAAERPDLRRAVENFTT